MQSDFKVQLCAVRIGVSEIVTQDNSEYNALEHDLAVVNLYFGSSTVYGQYRPLQCSVLLNVGN